MNASDITSNCLVVINDPLASVSDRLEEIRIKNSKQKLPDVPLGIHLQRIWIENDEIAKEIQQAPWKSLEIVSCQGSRMPDLIQTALQQSSIQKFALRKIASRLENCIRALNVSGLKYLQELTLEVALSERSCQFLALALDSSSPSSFCCCSLVNLHMERCTFIIPSALYAFAEGLKYNSSVCRLSLSKCKLRDDDLLVLIPNLPSSLKSLDLTDNYCRSQLNSLIDSGIQSLDVTNQHPGEFGGSLELSQLGATLSSNTTLHSLDVSFNMLNLDDIRGLLDVIAAENSTLQHLNLMNNLLDDTAIQYIGKQLPHMKGLRSLDISANRFGDRGAAALLEGLKQNYTLCLLRMPRGFEVEDIIQYFLTLNQGGRRILRCFHNVRDNGLSSSSKKTVAASVPLGIWPLVFERVNAMMSKDEIMPNVMQASVLFFLLQEGPITQIVKP